MVEIAKVLRSLEPFVMSGEKIVETTAKVSNSFETRNDIWLFGASGKVWTNNKLGLPSF